MCERNKKKTKRSETHTHVHTRTRSHSFQKLYTKTCRSAHGNNNARTRIRTALEGRCLPTFCLPSYVCIVQRVCRAPGHKGDTRQVRKSSWKLLRKRENVKGDEWEEEQERKKKRGERKVGAMCDENSLVICDRCKNVFCWKCFWIIFLCKFVLVASCHGCAQSTVSS